MKILAIIPARSGSKRLPGKNVKILKGKPLIEWSIDAIKDIDEICDILISTDDPIAAEISHNSGVLVPWLRPAELADDLSSSADVALHALNWYENNNCEVDGVLLLQPTSPFRHKETIIKGINLFKQNKQCSIVGFSPAQSHPWLCFKINGLIMDSFFAENSKKLRSQDLPPAFVVNGSFYLISPENLRITNSFYASQIIPLISDRPEEAIDIDSEWDWRLAEFIADEFL
ncbi:acylneuraminate cytidylyltransferase family protein [Candidatus Methylopumilus rimovensis]|uniref:Acylneuraminate cytidylyltransferase family protein n=1 Tax=Candidatus Methylopumilus rimovensis TaxID=2588535 RepID=A0AAE6FT01_9PROT|nr:acylneuraminate cytidylyltransferase family protein [Candidatus Methylopumilus rimovensis]QDD13372.1 acylneuraminate cytidylyltransferase family protein [Candidatus Methylopumilus rimovensis]